jgi:S1-C subfamily serine protease
LTTTGSETRQPAADLGLSLRWVSALGSEVVHVTPRSAGEAAGLAAGDIITSMGASASPTPSQLQAAFTRVDRGRALVIGFLRAGTPDVVAVVKP